MLFLYIFLYFTATNAAEGEQCVFSGATLATGCGPATTGVDATMKCVTQGGQVLANKAQYDHTNCSSQSPFKSCICKNMKVKKEAGQTLSDGGVTTTVCMSGVGYRGITNSKTKLAMDAYALGVDPKNNGGAAHQVSATFSAGTPTLFRAITNTVGYCGIPEGEFCIATELTDAGGAKTGEKTDFCMPGTHCYIGFGSGNGGICVNNDEVATKNDWLVKFRTDTLAKIAENKAVLDSNQAAIAVNKTAIAANLTAVEKASKENDDWFSGKTEPGDDVPDFKERGKLLLTITVFLGLLVLPSILYLVFKQCQQPAKRRRTNVKAADSDELSSE